VRVRAGTNPANGISASTDQKLAFDDVGGLVLSMMDVKRGTASRLVD
jgi:hypothetical protein